MDPIIITRWPLDRHISARACLVDSPADLVLRLTAGTHDLTFYRLPGTSPTKPLTKVKFNKAVCQLNEEFQTISRTRSLNIKAATSLDARLSEQASFHFDKNEHSLTMRHLTGALLIRPEDSATWLKSGKEAWEVQGAALRGEIPVYRSPLNCLVGLNEKLVHGFASTYLKDSNAGKRARVLLEDGTPLPLKDYGVFWAVVTPGLRV